jgi:hypothetical protein
LCSFPYRFRSLLSGKGRGQLHVVPKQLLDFSLCREDFPDVERNNPAYLDLLEFLLLYATISIEVLALARIGREEDILERLASSTLLSGDQVRVKVGDNEIKVLTKDLAALAIRQTKEETDESTDGLSLQQLSLLAFFACNVKLGNEAITIEKPQGFRKEAFQKFAHACLVLIPKVERVVEKEMAEVFSTIRSNENFGRIESLEDMREAANILVQDLCQVRSCFGISRRFCQADGSNFPLDVCCKTPFGRKIYVNQFALPGCALTNSFPSSREGYNCSLDISHGKPINLLIPSEGIHSLVQDLTKGKLFGFKLTYLYSGRLMAVWDGAFLTATFFALWGCEHTKDSTTASTIVKDIVSVLPYVLKLIMSVLLIKLVTLDISHWSTRYKIFSNFIISKFKGQS